MEFDVFEKLSELETEIHILKKELEEKDAFIQNLMDKNTDLERRLLSLDQNNVTGENNLSRVKEIALNGASIANMLKETSEAVVRNTGYTFDERTGLYYDHKSGYYYDPENQLFYEPKTGTYYKYNSETGEYTNYTASEDDAMNSKFKEFSHPVYAHLLKLPALFNKLICAVLSMTGYNVLNLGNHLLQCICVSMIQLSIAQWILSKFLK
ncbi:unnamed protein product [Schistosoma mattheei]|uniref:Uncharacterized protein n=1 Tax=Schistosoma mattheei TaxID=31246 RepID=A0A183P451_9TREM|nr:unnamed protein product [Schistosoma mattheei]